MKIQKWNVRRILFLTALILAFMCPSASVQAKEKAGMITDFGKVGNSCIRLSDHIPLEELEERMPREISVYLNGSETPVNIPADWVSSVDYELTSESYYLFMAKWDEEQYPLDPDYNEQGYFPFVEVEVRDGNQAAPIAAASGVSNIVKRAYQQVDIAWTPRKQVKGYIGLNGILTTTYYSGVTYHGMPYGQLVDSGKYVPHDASFDTFISAVKDSNSVFYKSRGSYMSRNSTYYGNDCSAFVSYAYGLPRMTTGMIAASSQFTRVSGNNIYNAQVGDCFNKSTSHVEMITGMLYNSSGTLVTVEVCEQTPPKARRVRYAPWQVQSLLNSGYVLLRFNGRDSVRPPYYYNGYSEKTDSLAYIGDKFYATIANKDSGKNAANDGAGNVSGQKGTKEADQVWYFEAQGDGTYIITSCKDGKCLGVDGSAVKISSYTGSTSQRWYFYRNNGKYKLVAANGSKILNLSNDSVMTIGEDTDSDKQRFEIGMLDRKGSVHTAEITLETDSYVYDGKAKKPAVKVKIGSSELVRGSDYKVAYSENVETGTAKVTITGKGDYTGEAVREFTIRKAAQDLQVTLSSETGKEKEKLMITASGNQTALKFSSANKDVAKVSQTGKVSCLKAGTAEIKIKAVGDKNHESVTRTVTVNVVHNYTAKTTKPTCTEKGYTTYTCKGCGDTYKDDYTEATGHGKDNGEVIKDPTCTKKGTIEYTCNACGTVYQEVMPAWGHEYGRWKSNNDGTHFRVCSNNTAHVETGECTYKCTVLKKPETGQAGELIYNCTDCGYTFLKDVTLETCIHEITEVRDAVEASCTKKGYTGDTYCEICGVLVEKGSRIPASGHTWDSGTVTKEPAVGKKGVRKFTCEVCGKTRSETIEALKNPLISGSVKKDPVSGGIYKIRKDRVSVIYTGPVSTAQKSVVIPDTVELEGVVCKVTAVAVNAFQNNKNLQQVVIGKNVQQLGNGAFRGCENLTEVSGGKGIVTIARGAFNNCVKLTGITLGPKVTALGYRAFINCRALTRIVIPETVTSIGEQAFKGCSGLKKIIIKTPALTNENTGADAFKGISSKAAATVPQEALGSYAKLLKAKGFEGRVIS